MKHLNILLLTVTGLFVSQTLWAQRGNIIGSWQLVKKSSCLEEGANTAAGNEGDQNDTSEASTSGQLISFRTNASGEESMRLLNSGKSANPKKFHYKFNGEMLLILDKKSQIISDSYTVEKFTADSLIISNAARPCETMIFVKINEEQPN